MTLYLNPHYLYILLLLVALTRILYLRARLNETERRLRYREEELEDARNRSKRLFNRQKYLFEVIQSIKRKTEFVGPI